MALVTTPNLYYPCVDFNQALNVARDKLIDASGERVAFIVTAPQTGTITSVDILTDAVTTADDLDVRIETTTETTATGYEPSGTLWGTNTNGTLSSGSISAQTMHNVSLTSGASVTAGDIISIVVQFTSDTTASGSLEIRSLGNVSHIFPIVTHRTGGSWTSDANAYPVVGLSYSGTYYQMFGGAVYTTIDTSTISTGKEYGIKFTPPFDCTLRGIVMDTRMATGTSFTVELYTTEAPGAGTELKASTQTPTTSNLPGEYHFASPPTLVKDTSYRITVDPTTSANSFPLRTVYESAALMEQDYGANWHFTEDDGAGGWTDTTTEGLLYFALIIGQVHDNDLGGGSGGLITHPGMSGGMRG